MQLRLGLRGGLQLLRRGNRDGELDGRRVKRGIDGRDGRKSVKNGIVVWVIVDIVGLRGAVGGVHEIGITGLVQNLQ